MEYDALVVVIRYNFVITIGHVGFIILGLPVIQKTYTNYTVVYGSSITMVCNITAFPKLLHVNWQRNNSGVLTIINEGAVGTGGISPNNPSLTIRSSSFADAGVYYCSATNPVGTERSDGMDLSVVGGTNKKVTTNFMQRTGYLFSHYP